MLPLQKRLKMWHNLQKAFIITRREIRDQFRDWRIIVPIIILTIFFPSLMNFTARQTVDFVQKYGADIVGDRLIPFLFMVVGFFPISVSLVIALESFVGEKERQSIEPLLNSPLTNIQLYLGKLFAVMFPPLLASYLGISVYLIGVYRQVGWFPNYTLLVQVLALVSVQTLVMVSGAVVISSQTTSARAANLLASFIIIPMAILLVGESMIMFWARYHVLWWAIFGQIVIAALLIRTGVAYFNREELLGRQLDTLNLPWAWHVFKRAFLGNEKGIGKWLKKNVGGAYKTLGWPIILSALTLLAGGILGSLESARFPIPPELLDWQGLEKGVVEGIEEFGPIRFFSAEGVMIVLYHNLRVILLASLLGIFSFGTLGLIVLMAPFGIIGYFSATVAQSSVPLWKFLLAFVLPHGILEIPAIAISGAIILRLGATLVAPVPGRTIREAWLHSFAEWAKILIIVVIPLLIGAAILEIYVTPQIALWLFR